MKHDYLKWSYEKTIGAVTLPESDVIVTENNKCIISCGDQLVERNIRTANSKTLVQIESTKCSTALLLIPQSHGSLLAFGDNEGSVSLLELDSGDIRAAFKGHSSAISALAYSEKKLLLASGSKDSKICIWDIPGETGLFKLSGHRGEVTSLLFLPLVADQVLVSTCRDGFVKFWDLETQHCFRTLVEHSGAVWNAVLFHSCSKLATVGADSFLRVWNLEVSSDEKSEPYSKTAVRDEQVDADKMWDQVDAFGPIKCTPSGELELPGRGPPKKLIVDNSGCYLICSRKNSLLFYRIRSVEEARKKMMKRAKKRNQKEVNSESTSPVDLRPSGALKMSDRIVSIVATRMDEESIRILAAFGSNYLESVQVSFQSSGEPNLISTWQLPQIACGHRGDIRCVQFSSDSSAIMSIGADYLKMWNRRSGNAVRTVHTPGATCGIFLPGDRNILIGNINGSLLTINLASGDVEMSTSCHDGQVSSLAISPDNKTVASCGADKTVRFLSVHVPIIGQAQINSQDKNSFEVIEEKILKLEDEPVCAQFSPDGRLVAVALLDSTIRIFYIDTLKFFLSLYGHKLPCTSLAISSDSTLIVSASKDRNVKIWGLDFGDCHKSIFAHDEAVTSVTFLPNTHHFFTAGADSKINRWDADVGQLISSHHHPGVTCLAANPAQRFIITNETYVVSGGNDGSLRLWKKTDEILVLSEEREEAEEKAIAEAAANSSNQPVEPPGIDSAVSLPVAPTVDALKAAEDIVESIELWKKEQSQVDEGETVELDPLVKAFGYISAHEMVGETLLKVKPSFLQSALLRLPASTVTNLLRVINSPEIVAKNPELITRVSLFLLRLHTGRLPNALEIIETIRRGQLPAISELRDEIGVNLAGLQMLSQALEEDEGITLFEDLTPGRNSSKSSRKKRKAKITSTVTTA